MGRCFYGKGPLPFETGQSIGREGVDVWMAAGDEMVGRLIDIHAHIGHWPFRRLSHNTPEGVVALAERFGIEKALVSNLECILYRDVHDGNLDLWERIRPFGEKLLPAYVINPGFPGWHEDLLECKEMLNARAIKLYPNYHGYSVSDGPARECLVEAGRLGLPVLLVVRVLDERCHHPLLLVPPVAMEDVSAAARAASGTTFVVCGAREHEIERLMQFDPGLSNVFFETSNIAAPVASVAALVRKFGSLRFVLGTNLPLNYPGAGIAKVLGPPLSRKDREAISHGNAISILSLGGECSSETAEARLK